jgi:hypothetical protein
MLQGFAMSNPVWPSAYDGVWNALIGLVSVCMFAALFDVMRKATPLRAIEWVVLIMLVPILGPSIWFIYGRNRFPDRR